MCIYNYVTLIICTYIQCTVSCSLHASFGWPPVLVSGHIYTNSIIHVLTLSIGTMYVLYINDTVLLYTIHVHMHL